MNIKREGFTSIPLLAKKKSILDQECSELLVGQALDEIFRQFQVLISKHKAIEANADFLEKSDWHMVNTNLKNKLIQYVLNLKTGEDGKDKSEQSLPASSKSELVGEKQIDTTESRNNKEETSVEESRLA